MAKISEYIPSVLLDVVAGVKAAKAEGVNCLLPDVVVFEVWEGANKVVFEVPLEDEGEEVAVRLEREAAKFDYSLPFMSNAAN